MTRLLMVALFVCLAGCQPYESQTLALGEPGIRKVLNPEEEIDAGPRNARRDAQRQAERDMRDQMMRDAVEQQRALAPSSPPPPWPGEGTRSPTLELPPGTRGSSSGRQPERRTAASAEFDACAARYQRAKADLARYGKTPPQYVMVKITVGKPAERVSCSQVKFRSGLSDERALVYSRALSECQPTKASGPVYEAAKAKADETQQECLALARRAGISPGEARARVR